MKRTIIFVIVAALAVLALCLCACDGTAPCQHELKAVEAVEATCAANGNVAYWKCDKCEKCFSDEKGETGIAAEDVVVAAKEHTEVIVPAVEPTCAQVGLTEGKKCSVCDAVIVAQEEVAALAHAYGEWAVVAEATCTAEGSKERACTVCGEKEIGVVDKLAHVSSKWIVDADPNCVDEGGCHKECTLCGEVLETEAIAALGHTEVVDEAVAPTCEKAGKTAGKHCSVCNIVLAEQAEVLALGHDWDEGEVAVEPTCTEKGVKTYKCARCEQAKNEEIAAVGHTEVVDSAVAPTCGNTGLTEGKHCSVCEAVLVEQQQIVAKGHKFADGVCTVCGEYEVSKGLEFALNADGTAYVVVGIGTCTDEDIVIPATYNGKPVTAIGAKAFENCTSLKTVTILNGLVSIAKDAFDGCTNLTDIILK